MNLPPLHRVQSQQRFFKPYTTLCLGFSLVEMLVVVAIIGLLAGLSVPAIGRAKAFSQQTTCTANLRTLHQASMNYAADFDGRFPVANMVVANSLGENIAQNFAIQLALEGYLGLPGTDFWNRLPAWIAISQKRAAFCLWCPAAEACENRLARGNMATYGMNARVGGDDITAFPNLKILQVATPTKTALFIDGCFTSGAGFDVRVGVPGLLPAAMHPPNLYKQSNNPARSLNVVFVDGHVETRRIGDIPTDFTNVFWTPNR